MPRLAPGSSPLAGGFQLSGWPGLALSEGGVVGFAELGRLSPRGISEPVGRRRYLRRRSVRFAERALRFAGDNLLWTGMFARSTALLAAAAALPFAAVLSAGAAPRRPRGSAGSGRAARAARAAAWFAARRCRGRSPCSRAPTAPGRCSAQNIDKPRHITPLIGLMWLLLLALFRAAAPA